MVNPIGKMKHKSAGRGWLDVECIEMEKKGHLVEETQEIEGCRWGNSGRRIKKKRFFSAAIWTERRAFRREAVLRQQNVRGKKSAATIQRGPMKLEKMNIKRTVIKKEVNG